ncbi:MAG: peptidase dimerization domain-containing protein, partial [Anaerolineae bacterium]|nr:peptidase dimerization domain-containing protein [Anaerolineae bacterium]
TLLSEADGCLWEFGSKNADENPVICLGVKGMAAFDLRVRTATMDAHSGNGGIFPNAAWRLTEALDSLRAPDGRVIIDGLLDHVRQPTEVEERLLESVPFNHVALQASYGFSNGLLGGLTGAAAVRRWLMEPALNVNGLVSGYSGPGSKTVIPAQATAKMDMRLVPEL